MRADNLEQLGFHKLRKEDLSSLRSYYDAMQKPYASSIALFSIFAWSHSLPAYYRIVGDYLLLIVFDRLEKRWVFLPIVGKYEQGTFSAVMKKVRNMAEQLEIPFVCTDISEWMLPYYEACFPGELKVVRDRDLSEYIYDTEEFLQYLNRQRERYNYEYFLKKYHPVCVEADKNHGKECKELLEKIWCPYHNCEECIYGCQKETLQAAMETVDDDYVKGILIYVEERLAAYVLLSCEKEQLVFHFKKNERGYRGLNEFIHKECVERFAGKLKNINYTEDMGIEGLRTYKEKLCAYKLEDKLEIHIGRRAE